MRTLRCLSLLAASYLGACSSNHESGHAADAGMDATVPAPRSDHPLCVISADCPAGEHCDLGECVQDCNAKDPCTGEATCSPRARCIAPTAKDVDPTPTTQYLGAISLSPATVALTDADKTLTLHLSSTSTSPVRYRIVTDAAYLTPLSTRGEFTGATDLALSVNTGSLRGRDVAGSVKVITTLGEATTSTPIHVGVTGHYRGHLSYDKGSVPIGLARISLDLIETNGQVSARVLSEKSLLFPAGSVGDVTGYGSYTPSSGVAVNVSQVIDPTFGGIRNHFGRPLGRTVTIHAKPTAGGNLEGTFTDAVYGLFSMPVTVSGSIQLVYEPQDADPSFTVATPPTMPPSPSRGTLASLPAIFGQADATDCPSLLSVANCAASATLLDCVTSRYYHPLLLSVIPGLNSSTKTPVPMACSASLQATSLAGWAGGLGATCAYVPPLACALGQTALGSVGDVANGKAFGKLFAETVAPALLVAKDDIVQGLKQSFVNADAELAQDDQATQTLAPVTQWVLQPAVLEYLRTMAPQAARGDDPPPVASNTYPDTAAQTYPSIRALADLLSTAAALDAERARARLARNDDQTTVLLDIQTRALLMFLETTTVTAVLDAWSASPPQVGAMFTGVLTPEDNAFASALLGQNVLGVPDGYVPFVYRAEDASKGATNFEQMAALAAPVIAAEKTAEEAYAGDSVAYTNDQTALQTQLAAVRSQYDLQLQSICGPAFSPDSVHSDADWSGCGASQSGTFGLAGAQIQAANDKIQSSIGRMKGMQDKIGIDKSDLEQTQGVHDQNINFISSTGQALDANIVSTAAVNAAEKFAELASQSDFFNFGGPAVGAAACDALEVEKGALESAKQDLLTAQQAHAEASSQSIEYINGMGNIQKEMIDVAQARVDLQLDIDAQLESKIQASNQLAQAKELFQQRAQALALVNMSSANDPSVRVLRDQYALEAIRRRGAAQQYLFLAGRALEYEINQSIPTLAGAVLGANNALALNDKLACLSTIFGQWRTAYGSPQQYVATVSVRSLFGITGPRTDSVTGETLTEGEQFRQILLRNQNLDGQGGVGLAFSTNLQPGNQLWSSDVCVDRISSIQAQIVGDYLGDNQAQINLAMAGSGILRDCDADNVESWSLGAWNSTGPDAVAVVQAGVNTYGDAPPNTSLFGEPVARPSWKVIIPGPAAAPSNSDIDLTHVEDIVLRITHTALPRKATPLSVDLSCLGS